MGAHVARTQIFSVLDEASGYLKSKHTKFRKEWTIIRNRARGELDRFGTPHAASLKEHSELTALVRRYRVKEGEALHAKLEKETKGTKNVAVKPEPKRMMLKVLSVTYKYKNANGNSVFELDTDKGKFRTAAGSRAGVVLNSRDYRASGGKPMIAEFTSRGTISNVAARG